MAFVLIINIGFLLYLAYNILSFEMIKNLKLIIPLIAFSLLHLSLLLPLSEREKEVEELRELSSKIQAAYFLNSFYQRYEDSIKAKEKVSEQLAVNTDILPEVTEKKEECAKILEVKKADRNKALEEFTPNFPHSTTYSLR